MKIKSLRTDEHVTEGLVYYVEHQDEDAGVVIVLDNDGELWDLFSGEYEVIEEA